jgi:hypothetical protein
VGEDLGPRERDLEGRDRPVTRDAVRAFARTAWKVTLVLVLTIVVMWAIGWTIQAITGGSDDQTATVTEER